MMLLGARTSKAGQQHFGMLALSFSPVRSSRSLAPENDQA